MIHIILLKDGIQRFLVYFVPQVLLKGHRLMVPQGSWCPGLPYVVDLGCFNLNDRIRISVPVLQVNIH